MVKRVLAQVLEVAGAVCVVVAGALVAPALGWFVAGVALIVLSIDRDVAADEAEAAAGLSLVPVDEFEVPDEDQAEVR